MSRDRTAAAVVLLLYTSIGWAQGQQPAPSSPPPNQPAPTSQSAPPPAPSKQAAPPSAQPRPPAARPRPAPRPRPPVVRPRPPHHFLSGGRWRPSIRGPKYYYPPGFTYRHWATGAFLPRIFLAPPYYYDSYVPLGLGPPPAGYRWVRYGPDLLLVDAATGRIADVVEGVFY